MTPGSEPSSSGTESPGLALYVHFPFCAHRCHYCDYAVEPAARPPVDAWLEAVDRELELRSRSERWDEPPRVATIHVGGGTPSLMGGGVMEGLGEILGRRFRLERPSVEWTAEANPEGLDRGTAAGWRAAGVNRVSLGVQSFDDRALRWLGRLHDSRRAVEAIDTARGAGVAELSVDLLYGIPGGLGRDWDADVARVREMGIPHVSLYGLTAESGTPLARWVEAGASTLADEPRSADEYLRASRALQSGGWEHYEIGSLARPGHRSRHGLGVWSSRPLLGVGPSSHGFLPPRRYRNVGRWDEYRTTVEAGTLPVSEERVLDQEALQTERIWLRLRTREGLRGPLARTLQQKAPGLVGRLQDRGWLVAGEGHLALTPHGWLRMDDLAAALMSRVLEES